MGGWCGCGQRTPSWQDRCEACCQRAKDDIKRREALPVGGTSCLEKDGEAVVPTPASGNSTISLREAQALINAAKRQLSCRGLAQPPRDDFDGWRDNALRALEDACNSEWA